MGNKHTMWLKFEGKGVQQGKKISLSLLSDNLLEFNKLAKKIVENSELIDEKHPKELFDLYLVDIKEGSFGAALKYTADGQLQSRIDFSQPDMRIDPLVEAEQKIKETLEHTESDDDYSFFKEHYEMEKRIDIIKNMKNLCPTTETSVALEFEDDETQEISYSVLFNDEKRSRFERWLKSEEPSPPELKGVFNGFKSTEKSSVMYITLLNGEEATCYYDPDIFQSKIDSTCRYTLLELEGEYSKEPGVKTIPKITNIKRIKEGFTLKYKKVGEIELAKPLVLEVEWLDETFLLKNESYSIIVGGENEKEFLNQLEFALEYVRDVYFREKDETLTLGAQELKRRLQDLFGPLEE